MASLSVRSFRPFFKAIHGTDPFPWQQRLVEMLNESGRWPEALDLPTGTGKTAALDAAVFHLALEADKPQRRAPMRVLYVVDRRTIVDQAYERAKKIRAGLTGSPAPAVAAVRERLSGMSREGDPLAVAVLRGGVARDDGWARSPDQPLVAVSTVDQVGSRLLFRGYGVSNSMRPVHAGLIANDALILLDEVHLSQPFVGTLEQLANRYGDWPEVSLPRRWQCVPMSATPRTSGKDTFRLTREDERHPVLERRLTASRPARLREVAARGEGEPAQRALAGALFEEALGMVRPGRAVALVVNRVATARSVFASLQDRLGDRADVWLLTGRMRPIEREELERKLRARVGAGRVRRAEERPAVVVATQCIEAGADLDFDGLVTECASLDALRQRFGRLNRFGDIDDAEGVVVARKDSLKSDDPIYGPALAKTWAYLSKLGKLDFGLTRFRAPPRKDLPDLLPPVERSPVLLPAHLDSWVQTAPVPAVDPEVALWLHGPERGEPEVQIVWRADLTEAMFAEPEGEGRAVGRVESCPPSTPEALTVPIGAARRWLARVGDLSGPADVEGVRISDAEVNRALPVGRRVLAWRGEQSEVIEPRRVRPGDTLVVPAEYGGLAHGSWAPDSEAAVADLGDRAYVVRHGKALLRLNPAVLASNAQPAEDGGLPAWVSPPLSLVHEDAARDDSALLEWLDLVLTDTAAPGWLRDVSGALSREILGRRPPRVVRIEGWAGEGPYYVLAGRAALSRTEPANGSTTEDDTASFTGREITLHQHLEGVEGFARDFASRCGLVASIVDDVALAGRWHDAGKADPRFQAMLRGGSVFAVDVASEPLAKSAIPAPDRAAREAARVRAGYPKGARHELVSLALINAAAPIRSSAHDWDLVQHLVASHHGHCRPFAPYAADDGLLEIRHEDGGLALQASSAHGMDSLDSGVSDRFWRLVRRYGWFGLAWLEAILRLADHRRSELEQRGEPEGSS